MTGSGCVAKVDDMRALRATVELPVTSAVADGASDRPVPETVI